MLPDNITTAYSVVARGDHITAGGKDTEDARALLAINSPPNCALRLVELFLFMNIDTWWHKALFQSIHHACH
jgi:hypothetical protein